MVAVSCLPVAVVAASAPNRSAASAVEPVEPEELVESEESVGLLVELSEASLAEEPYHRGSCDGRRRG